MKKPSKRSHTPSKNSNGSLKGDWHVNHSSMGMGDYYGTGVKAKLGKMIDGTGMATLSKGQLGKPPKSLA